MRTKPDGMPTFVPGFLPCNFTSCTFIQITAHWYLQLMYIGIYSIIYLLRQISPYLLLNINNKNATNINEQVFIGI